MASKPKAPMPVTERAKQFLPFAALKGFEEALERQEAAADAPAAAEKQATKRGWESGAQR